MLMEKERRQIVEFSKRLLTDNLTKGTSGNISIYRPDLAYMAISPSGMDYNMLTPEDVVVMDLDHRVIEGARKPSSEYDLHCLVYQNRPDIASVIHTHSTYCTVLATVNQPLRAVHYVLADADSPLVPIAPYRTFGSKELAQVVVETMGQAKACLMQNHGMIACGSTIEAAYGLAATCEWVAEVQWKCLCIGQPNYLSDQEMNVVMDKFKAYGQDKGDQEARGYLG